MIQYIYTIIFVFEIVYKREWFITFALQCHDAKFHSVNARFIDTHYYFWYEWKKISLSPTSGLIYIYADDVQCTLLSSIRAETK